MKYNSSSLLSILFLSTSFVGCDTDPVKSGVDTPSETPSTNSNSDTAEGREVTCPNGETTVVEWGVETCAEPEVFPASDVSQSTVDLALEWYGVASEAWGNFGPVEIYLVGDSVDAAKALENVYCEHHKALDSNWNEEWECANENYQIFSRYPEEGGAAVSHFRRIELNYDFLMLILSPKYPDPNEEDYKPVVMHEYFHIYQHAHIQDECSSDSQATCSRDSKMGGKGKPWFAEGSAEFMGQSLYAKQPGVREGYLKEVMERKLESLADYKAQDTRLEELTYGDSVNVYDIGSWFIAYLIHKEGEQTFLVDFFTDLDELGFEASFEAHFGKTGEAYVDEFDVFMDQPQEQLLAIIP